MGLFNCPWKVDDAILDTGAGPNLIRMDAMDESWRTSINQMAPHGLRSAASTPLLVSGNVQLVTQIGQRVADTRFLVVDNLVVNVLLGTAFIGDNADSITPGEQLIRSMGSGSVVILVADR